MLMNGSRADRDLQGQGTRFLYTYNLPTYLGRYHILHNVCFNSKKNYLTRCRYRIPVIRTRLMILFLLIEQDSAFLIDTRLTAADRPSIKN